MPGTVEDNVLTNCGTNPNSAAGVGGKSAIDLRGDLMDVRVVNNRIVDTGTAALIGYHAIYTLALETAFDVVVRDNELQSEAGSFTNAITPLVQTSEI